MSDNKKSNLFAKLAEQNAKATGVSTATDSTPAENASPSPALLAPARSIKQQAKVKEPPKGKRDNPDFCQANAYVPKTLRKAVDRALLDMDGTDYSTLVTDLLRKWIKSKGLSE